MTPDRRPVMTALAAQVMYNENRRRSRPGTTSISVETVREIRKHVGTLKQASAKFGVSMPYISKLKQRLARIDVD